jgi:hypothetical protein
VKCARIHFENFPVLSEAERLARLEGMRGVELCGLMHYAEGREPSPTRDQVIGLVLVVAGERYLAKQTAKARKKVKRIL